MSLFSNLIRLIPPSLRANYCPNPNTYQQLANDIIGGTRAVLLIDNGATIYNYGNVTPLPKNRIFPWINTDTGKVYIFKEGLWTTPYSYEAGPNGLRIDWEAPADGSAAGLWTFGGGDGTDPTVTTPTSTTGSFWTIDPNYAGRVTMAPGAVPVTTNPAVTTVVSDTGGEGQHTLAAAEGGSQAHSHYFGLRVPGNDDVFLRIGVNKAGVAYTGYLVTGDDGNHEDPQTTTDLQTLDSDGVVALPHNNLQPYRVAYKAKRTGRVYQTLPP